MELGTGTRSTTALLSSINAAVRGRQDLLIEEWQGIVEWAQANVVNTLEGAATIAEGSYLDTGVPIAGAGAPLVSEFALMDLIAVLGRTPDGGRAYVGRVLGCAWRLPETWAQVQAGRVEPWRAERVADLTGSLSFEAAAFVDHQLAIAVGRVSWALIERLVTEAVIRFDPERAEADRQKAADQRHFDISGVTEQGRSTSTVSSMQPTDATSTRRSPARPTCSASSATSPPSTSAGPRQPAPSLAAT